MKKEVKAMSLLGIVFLFSLNFISAVQWSIEATLNSWASSGVFTYLLPFLLVFALVFAILMKTKLLGDNKAASVIIAAALGLMSLVGDYFPKFLEKFAPNISIALCVMLGIMILLGLFYDFSNAKGYKWIIWVFIIVGIIAFFFVLGDTFGPGNIYGSNLWDEYGPAILTLIILGGIIGVIVAFSKESKT
jgi:hypothetical protein